MIEYLQDLKDAAKDGVIISLLMFGCVASATLAAGLLYFVLDLAF